jgi:hypothetical protein
MPVPGRARALFACRSPRRDWPAASPVPRRADRVHGPARASAPRRTRRSRGRPSRVPVERAPGRPPPPSPGAPQAARPVPGRSAVALPRRILPPGFPPRDAARSGAALAPLIHDGSGSLFPDLPFGSPPIRPPRSAASRTSRSPRIRRSVNGFSRCLEGARRRRIGSTRGYFDRNRSSLFTDQQLITSSVSSHARLACSTP